MIYCDKCGHGCNDNAAFCTNCGNRLTLPKPPQQQLQAAQGEEQQYGIHPTLCSDGKYRWTYEVNLLKNPTIFIDLMMALGWCFGLVFVVAIIGGCVNGMLDWDGFKNILTVFFWIIVFMFFLSSISYLIWAFSTGKRYAALFIMDENGITHEQMPKQIKSGQVAGQIAMLVGALSDDLTAMGAGMIAASVNAWRSDYKTVRRMKLKRRRHLIKVNELFTKNRIYAEPEDIDFVANYIWQRCPRLHK